MRKVSFSGLILMVIIGAHLFFCLGRDVSKRLPGDQDSAFAATAKEETAAVSSPAANQPAVEVPLEKQQTMGIKTAAAAVRSLKKTLRTVGRVEFDETKLTTVNIKVDGWIEKLYADYTGKYVDKGAPLAEIYSQELMSVQLEYINLLKWKPSLGLRTQRTMEFSLGDRYGVVGRLTIYDLDPLVDVVRQKLSLWDISEKQIKEIETSNQPMRTLTVRSPASGYVLQKPVLKGTRVAQGEKICDIVDLSTVWVLADIYEYEIPFVKAGQDAKITLSYYPQKEFISKVDFVYPSLSGQTRTAKARFVIPNPDLLLKPQMFADVEMELDLGQRLAVPETAVLDTGTRQIVYVETGEGLFSGRQIKVGDRADGMVEVVSGLKAGEKVASSAVFLIDSEAKLKGVSQ
jgi:membrane fusion protein, copper/silver efflux system